MCLHRVSFSASWFAFYLLDNMYTLRWDLFSTLLECAAVWIRQALLNSMYSQLQWWDKIKVFLLYLVILHIQPQEWNKNKTHFTCVCIHNCIDTMRSQSPCLPLLAILTWNTLQHGWENREKRRSQGTNEGHPHASSKHHVSSDLDYTIEHTVGAIAEASC